MEANPAVLCSITLLIARNQPALQLEPGLAWLAWPSLCFVYLFLLPFSRIIQDFCLYFSEKFVFQKEINASCQNIFSFFYVSHNFVVVKLMVEFKCSLTCSTDWMEEVAVAIKLF